MLTSTFRFDLVPFERFLSDVERRQLPYVAVLTLNETVKGGRKAVQDRMDTDLDRPTPFAKRGVVFERATKTNLSARVVIHGSRAEKGGLPAAYFLGPQVEGGQRSLKAFEKQLLARGLLPAGHVVVPAERLDLDRYGNIPQGTLNRIMSGLNIDYRGAGATRVASTEKGKKRRSGRGRYFVPKAGSKMAPGVWFEPGFPLRAVYPVLMFVRMPTYAKRLRFHEAVQTYAAANMQRHFDESWPKAMRTAR